jgi:ABC-type bacteriocin/lantibiotic exporter with double-glycine peptidase domain
LAKKRVRTLAGAGGEWIVRDERRDAKVIAQIGETHCCAACAAMVLQDRGIFISQHTIADALGVPTLPSVLPRFLNKHDRKHLWKYGYVAAGFDALHRKTPWIALFKDHTNPLLHAVVVDGMEGRFLRIRDPSEPGTTYLMTPENFQTEHHGWAGLAIYAEPRRRPPARRK